MELTFERFKKEYFDLYPTGDADVVFTSLKNILDDKYNTYRDNNGEIQRLSFEVVTKRYKDYLNNWNEQYAEKAARGYLKSDNEKATPAEFLYRNLFKNEYSSFDKNPDRSFYLFGNDKERLKREYNYFINFVVNKKKIPLINDIPIKKEKESNINNASVEIKPSNDAEISLEYFDNDKKDNTFNSNDEDIFKQQSDDIPF